MPNALTVSLLVSLLLVLSGCATSGNNASVATGKNSSHSATTKGYSLPDSYPRVDVAVPVFDPGLPADSDTYKKLGIWPELRRAEAKKFALDMKRALEDTKLFGAVRVTPDNKVTAELYVLGTIRKSNGEDVTINIRVVDISDKKLFSRSFTHRVKEGFYDDLRNTGKDSYAPVFRKAANAVAQLMKRKSAKELKRLQSIADIRFAAFYADDAFAQYLKKQNGMIKLTALPAENDPMLIRTKQIRVREGLFIDDMQAHYESFEREMGKNYLAWRKQSVAETKSARLASQKGWGQTILGALLVGASLYTGIHGNTAEAVIAADVGITGGAAMMSEGAQSRREAKFHREALVELGTSIDIDMGPRVISFEDKTIELTGKAQEQYAQWQAFLKRIYAEEATPDRLL